METEKLQLPMVIKLDDIIKKKKENYYNKVLKKKNYKIVNLESLTLTFQGLQLKLLLKSKYYFQ